MSHRPTTLLAEFTALEPARRRLREIVRDLAIRGLALGRRPDAAGGWIRFPYYHHVFDDERAGFARQLDYMRGVGEFISLDDAVALLAGGDAIDGRYFVIGFDDGFKSCATGALPILAERGIPAIFYVVTDMVGHSLAPDDAVARGVFDFKGRETSLDFVTWDDCRSLIANGMTVGSHSRSHARLADLDAEAAASQMRESKARIEAETGRPCRHFCPPYGRPGVDFLVDRDPAIAQDMGYRSFVVGRRGASRAGADPFALRRDHMMAGWGDHQLRYFLSQP